MAVIMQKVKITLIWEWKEIIIKLYQLFLKGKSRGGHECRLPAKPNVFTSFFHMFIDISFIFFVRSTEELIKEIIKH